MDRIIRGISENARFIIADTTEIVKKSSEIHSCTPGAVAGFGRFLTAGVLMGATLKGEDILSLRTETDGLLGQMLLTVNSKGNIKGYLENPGATLSAERESTISTFIGKGVLRVIKDMGLKKPYIGVSEMNSGDIAQDIAYYYYTSEQIPTVISLGVSFDKEGNIAYAGGYMIQILPNANEDFIKKLENKISIMKSFTELRRGGMELERIINLIYEDIDDESGEKNIEPYKILEEKKITYACNCSREKMHDGVIAIGEKEIDDIIAEKGLVNVECHFCGKNYSFEKIDFKDDFK
ncbi:MAG: Hsp33 family molecular chaperone HslO [Fusobacteriaceae bacterium]